MVIQGYTGYPNYMTKHVTKLNHKTASFLRVSIETRPMGQAIATVVVAHETRENMHFASNSRGNRKIFSPAKVIQLPFMLIPYPTGCDKAGDFPSEIGIGVADAKSNTPVSVCRWPECVSPNFRPPR